MSISWLVILLLNYVQHSAAPVPCPRHIGSQCKGPYVIRPARHAPDHSNIQCQADQWAEMTSCMQRCQQDVCCRAFGLDAAGACVTSNVTTETLHFVKESQDPLQISCFPEFCSQCRNEAVCELQNDQPRCVCATGFEGEFCETDNGPVISGVVLSAATPNMINVGDWGPWDFCPTGSYVAGMALKLQPRTGSGDNTALNAIRLYCKSARTLVHTAIVMSQDGPFGSWEGPIFCRDNYWIVVFRIYYEPEQAWPNDNTAANGLEVKCLGPGTEGSDIIPQKGVAFMTVTAPGAWSVQCPIGSAVCGLQTRVQPAQGTDWAGIDIDDAGLTDAKMQCCEL